MAELILVSSLTTSAALFYHLKALWTFTQMTREWALVTTILVVFLTLSTTSWLNLPTSHWRVNFSDSTRAEEWFSRVNLAWLTRSDVAKIITLMLATTQGFTASIKTKMSTGSVSHSLFDRAANLLTFVLLADFVLTAYLLTNVISDILKVFFVRI